MTETTKYFHLRSHFYSALFILTCIKNGAKVTGQGKHLTPREMRLENGVVSKDTVKLSEKDPRKDQQFQWWGRFALSNPLSQTWYLAMPPSGVIPEERTPIVTSSIPVAMSGKEGNREKSLKAPIWFCPAFLLFSCSDYSPTPSPDPQAEHQLTSLCSSPCPAEFPDLLSA